MVGAALRFWDDVVNRHVSERKLCLASVTQAFLFTEQRMLVCAIIG